MFHAIEYRSVSGNLVKSFYTRAERDDWVNRMRYRRDGWGARTAVPWNHPDVAERRASWRRWRRWREANERAKAPRASEEPK